MNLRMQQSVRNTRKGLTLIELLIVLVVLAATAAVVVPKLGFVADQASYAQAAAGSADLTSNIEQYKTSTGKYPNNFDSLLNSTGTVSASVWGHSAGTNALGLIPSADSGAGIYSALVHSGISSVYDLDDTVTTSVTYATTNRALSSTSALIAEAPTGSSGAKKAYPVATSTTAAGTVPTGYRLVAFGIGPYNSAVGTTMVSAPSHHGAVSGKYNRFIALFEVKEGGSAGAVKLKGVYDSLGGTIDSRVTNFKSITP